jgi:hypothetical protein
MNRFRLRNTIFLATLALIGTLAHATLAAEQTVKVEG